MGRIVSFSWLILALCCFGPGPASAAGRVALVIGNAAYRNVPQLLNPANDASDVAASLGRLGFSVDLLKDAGFDDLRRALIGFGAKARDADFAVIYFAGHGMEVAGENWVIPADAALAADRDVENEAIGLKSLTLAVSGARSLGLVILDACRNNPFDAHMQRASRSRAVSRGLAPLEPTGNVLVAYSAKDGTTATDGEGRNSPFTAALLSHIETPGLEIDFLFRNVRDDVLKATDGQQQPFAYGSLSREAVYLQPAPATAQDAAPGAAPAADDIAWPFVATTTDPALVRRFTAQFPASRHRAQADQRLAVLEAASPLPTPPIATTTDPRAQAAALATPEQGAVARQFNASSPKIEAAWALVKTSADPAMLKRFTAEFPSRERKTISAALNGIGGSAGVLRQLRAEEMHAVLADYGRFTQHERYGEVWVPTVVPPGWHPYEPCHWVKTRQFDWFYLDRTPWGAIVHHFGRWAHDEAMGWVWVPGIDFSPGWVLWRADSQQIGWAPMPPAEDVHTISAARLESADAWTFMDRADFTRGCGAAGPAAPSSRSALFVRELKIVGGLPVFVLPLAAPDQPIDVDVAFEPWPAWLVSQAIVDWNQLWLLAPALCTPVPMAPIKVRGAQPPAAPTVKMPAKAKHPQQADRTMPWGTSFPPRGRAVPRDRWGEPVGVDPPFRPYGPRAPGRPSYPGYPGYPVYPVSGFGGDDFGGASVGSGLTGRGSNSGATGIGGGATGGAFGGRGTNGGGGPSKR